MLIKRASDIPSSEITSENLYHNRREFIKTASAALGIAAAGTIIPGGSPAMGAAAEPQAKKGQYDVPATEKSTPYEDITTYNNYYEFGTNKEDPSNHSKNFKPRPWTVNVEGMVKKPATYNLDDLIKGLATEDRIYRMRCVEAWSMVIPWQGFPLASLISRLEPLPSAKYIEFKTLLDKKPYSQFPEQGAFLKSLDWPYVEGLRLDEATNPLALIATGIYGKPLPNQNGAPWRLVTPWKYGFKGIKAIVNIRFTDNAPLNSWQREVPQWYGFYANVNPNVDHPRWSQARERRIGEFFKRPTLMFNGYSDQVAQMYSGMDLRKFY